MNCKPLSKECQEKLKDMGWKAPEEVVMFLSLIAEDNLKKARVGYVKWDREKVLQVCCDNCLPTTVCPGTDLEECEWQTKIANQLKEILGEK